MAPIDEPVSLKFNSGNTLPPNIKIIAIVVSALAVFLIFATMLYVGLALLVLNVFVLTQRQVVEINEEKNFVHDYSVHFGFIKIGKKYPLDKYKYVTAMPLLESAQIYGRSSNSTIISNNYHSVTLFGNRLRGKRILKKYDSRSEAIEAAQKLANRLNLKFFEYDPKLVRAVLRGEREL
ncbi:MAG: hypothetical protein NXI10_08440 [bacterium]|nr:hypothetical protein [bacterium]